MCLNGVTYCVKVKDIAKKMECGYTLGPCDMQQSAACINTQAPDTNALNCVCSGRLVSVNVRYIGAAYQTVNASAKDCSVPIGSYQSLATGDMFTIDAADGGLSYLRNHTYVGVDGSSNGNIRIPTNCCDNPIGKTYFPFQVIGWVDTDGNTCGMIASNQSVNPTVEQAKVSAMIEEKASISEYPNPAETTATFDFSVPNTEVVTVAIVGINGQLIETIANREVTADQSYSITYDVSELQSGIYFVHLTSSEGVLKEKFVVLK